MLIRQSPLAGPYDKEFDRETAYEVLTARATAASEQVQAGKETPSTVSVAGEFLGGLAGQAVKSAVRQVANQLGRQLVRGLLGSLLGSKSASKRR
jgi:hypothetical protein